MDLDPITGEITYGLERIAGFLQDVDSIYDIVWARDPRTGREVTYGDMRLEEELQLSVYSFEAADADKLWAAPEPVRGRVCDPCLPPSRTRRRRRPASRSTMTRCCMTAPRRPRPRLRSPACPCLGAYELCLKCSHLFNLLDARGAISVTERVAVMARIRTLVVGVAKAYAAQRAAA